MGNLLTMQPCSQAKDQKAEHSSPKLFSSQSFCSNHLQTWSRHCPVTQFILLRKYCLCHFTALQSTVSSCRNTLLSKEIQQRNSVESNLRHMTKSVVVWISFCQVSLCVSFHSCRLTCSFFFSSLF